MSTQGWIVCLIVAGAALGLLFRLSRSAKGTGCGCGKADSCCARKTRS